jgi:preprotein translocase SecE subunit
MLLINTVAFFYYSKFLSMVQFLKDSIREMKHVVWPTKAETIQYFKIVVITLILFWAYLAVFNLAFTEALFFAKEQVTQFLAQ